MQKGPCAILFNANGTLAGDHDGNCTTTTGRLAAQRVDHQLLAGAFMSVAVDRHLRFLEQRIRQRHDGCVRTELRRRRRDLQLSAAGRIDARSPSTGPLAPPSVVITGQLFGTEPTPEAVPSSCSATGDDFVGGGFLLADVTGGWPQGGSPGTALASWSASSQPPRPSTNSGSRYDTAPSNHVLNAGDQLTVGVHSRTVLAYVDGFSGGAATNDASPGAVYSPATT